MINGYDINRMENAARENLEKANRHRTASEALNRMLSPRQLMTPQPMDIYHRPNAHVRFVQTYKEDRHWTEELDRALQYPTAGNCHRALVRMCNHEPQQRPADGNGLDPHFGQAAQELVNAYYQAQLPDDWYAVVTFANSVARLDTANMERRAVNNLLRQGAELAISHLSQKPPEFRPCTDQAAVHYAADGCQLTVVKMVDSGYKPIVRHSRRRGQCRAAAPTVQGGSALESHQGTPS